MNNKLLYALLASVWTQMVYADIITESSVTTSIATTAVKPIQTESNPTIE